MNQPAPQNQWLKVLGKGMVTLPKKWREDLKIETGDIVKAKKEGNKVIIEGLKTSAVPYRTYSDSEIDEFLKADRISKTLLKKINNDLSGQVRA